jgi:hypothetical protein
MLNCPACGVTNRPYDTDCVLCKEPIQEAGAAAAKRREWDALPAALRQEQEKAFDRMREGILSHLQWLKRHRVTHAVMGAVVTSLLMNGAVFFALGWPILIDLAVGAGAGLYLNRLKGGSWHGMGVFVGAAVLTVILKTFFMNTTAFLNGIWFFSCFAVFMLAGFGYLMGMKMDFDHTDHNVTP